MKWRGFESHSIEGDNFIYGMMETDKLWQKARERFTDFTENNGFAAWHIHDGWVRNGNTRGDVLLHEEINLTWIEPHAGYSHSFTCPQVGETMIIVKDSPHGDETKPFELYCYKVVGNHGFLSRSLRLLRTEIKLAIFNHEAHRYEFYVKKPWWNIFFQF
jgi:hypothetical protein